MHYPNPDDQWQCLFGTAAGRLVVPNEAFQRMKEPERSLLLLMMHPHIFGFLLA